MKLTLVKFDDNKYALRRWSFWGLGYVYLDNKGNDYWWGGDYFPLHFTGTKKQILSALATYLYYKAEDQEYYKPRKLKQVYTFRV